MSRREQRQIDRRRPHKLRKNQQLPTRYGKVRYGLAAWLLGLPLPFILLALVWGGCDW